MTERFPARAAMSFVVMMGIVSLLADACYEGARSAIGPYLAELGANATAVGVVAGTGELVGYALRYVSGRLADRTRAYWALTIVGYGTNLVAVPLLALIGSWQAAAALVVLERLGKAIRNPARSTLLSFAATEVGHGRAFAIHEALDQVGGVVGPVIVGAVLWWRGGDREGYAWAFAILAIPAVLTMVTFSTSASALTGFWRIGAPKCFASVRTSKLAGESVTKRKGTWMPAARAYESTSTPFMVGSSRALTTASMPASVRRIPKASRPSDTTRSLSASEASTVVNQSRRNGLSSATRIDRNRARIR